MIKVTILIPVTIKSFQNIESLLCFLVPCLDVENKWEKKRTLPSYVAVQKIFSFISNGHKFIYSIDTLS